MEKKHPYVIKELPGTKYYCACGRSQNLPNCDGSHKGSDFQPWKVEINEEKTVAICSCGRSARLPFCDGAHKTQE